ncbi:MAG: hypothetical protein M0R17_10565 [Candidatus Omnitrophica bacterium]|jgi:hypothetical protein|nr:hypothetical protein [Candidatus Omnitrophota bacterium]
MRKTIQELKKINTKNLLRYYRAERKRFNICGYREVLDYEDDEDMQKLYDEHKTYLNLIKTELNTREHIS